jgi:hypothetical protein
MTDLNEAIQFFESQPGMDKLFRLLRDELLTHRRIKGHVKLDGFSLIELESIAHFFKYPLIHLKSKVASILKPSTGSWTVRHSMAWTSHSCWRPILTKSC